MAPTKLDGVDFLRKHLIEAEGTDTLRELILAMAQKLMGAEVDALCNAERHERAEDRTNSRNGYRERRWDTRVGTMNVPVPKLRQGSYSPSWLFEPRRRAEQALVSVVADCYLRGVSTRRVDALVQTMGIEGISTSQVSKMAQELDESVRQFRERPLDCNPYPYLWLDALVHKRREGGRIVNVATVVAVGVNAQGRREVLGVDVFTSEDGAAWLSFLRDLAARGLDGVVNVTSDAHGGLKNAIATVFPGAAWQRCRTHFMRNLLGRVPKTNQDMVASLVRSVFSQPNAEAVRAQYSGVIDKLYEAGFEVPASMLANAESELLAFTHLPKAHWRQVWSNNPQERLNKEIRRRTDVVGIFPNRMAIIRLVGALLAEQHDEWQVARCYLRVEPKAPTEPPALAAPSAAA